MDRLFELIKSKTEEMNGKKRIPSTQTYKYVTQEFGQQYVTQKRNTPYIKKETKLNSYIIDYPCKSHSYVKTECGHPYAVTY